MLTKKDYALQNPYQTRAKTKIMINIKQVQEQMKADMKVMKEQMTMMMEAIIWYTNLEPSWVHSWKDLMDSFIKQYQYNFEMTPDRMQLQNVCKRDNESFKEHAQRWRDLAAQVVPPMTERDDNNDNRHTADVLL